MKTVILAGGFGTRLQSVVKDIPKPMADINGTPFLALLMQNMLGYGTTEFILCVSHLREVIQEYFGDTFYGVPVKYSVEAEALGTGGALKQAFDLYNLDRAMVLNGDSFVQMDYRRFYQENSEATLAIALKYMDDASRYGLVQTAGEYVTSFREKSADITAGLINAGIYVVDKQLWQFAPLTQKFSFEQDVLVPNIQQLQAKYFLTDSYFIDIGIPASYSQACRELQKVIKHRAVFLDRDGVINVDKHHVYKIEDCEFVEGIFDFCRRAVVAGYQLIVVTNQAGIAKGLYTEADFVNLMNYMRQEFTTQGCALTDVFYCPYHEDGIGQYRQDSMDRKPNPGMILKAAEKYNIDLSKSIMIGDKTSDVEAGERAGVGRNILFNSSRDNLAVMGQDIFNN